ncbi:MAG TPA: cysteine hydrolase [Burkholderiaceae bacterium]|nr:cysteine hydrolase [Burkholderiaceae bacterium]
MTTGPEIHLLVIDPQNDFCDGPSVAGAPDPALPVAGGHQDMLRLSRFIERASASLRAVHVTLDSHHPLHIAHPLWWIDRTGHPPAPFTVIRAEDVQTGKWRSRNPAWQGRSRAYVEALEAGGRYTLVVWPEHCLIGHWGHNVHPAVAHQLARWARDRLQTVDYIFKGSNPFTEHYSAVQAEVPDPSDPGTLLNARLLEALSAADSIIVAGEALSHCVANTVRDLACNLGAVRTAKLTLLADCTSSVGGFENLGADFLGEMAARGMKSVRSVDLFG